MDELTVGVLRSWARAALADLDQARPRIDELNVYPVPDGDTGTNLYLTWQAACDALPAGEVSLIEAASAFARGALLGARGNSGTITAQLLSAFAQHLTGHADAPVGAELVAEALRGAADAAYGAVAEPVEGTMLTVARAAATGAREAAAAGRTLAETCLAAIESARRALAATTGQLDALRQAGVVDAGGAGLLVILTALTRQLTDGASGVPGPAGWGDGRAEEGTASVGDDVTGADRVRCGAAGTASAVHPGGAAYEVMYLLDAADERVGAFRQALADVGDSVVVVGGDGLWNVHVHTGDVGAAIERGIEVGRPHRIVVTPLPGEMPAVRRAVVAVAAGDGLAGLFEAAGATVIRPVDGQRCTADDLLAAVARSGAAEVVLLPNDRASIAVAESAAATARRGGVRVAVIRTRAQVQGLAAIAVHDPGQGFDEEVGRLSAAAGQTRHGAVTVALADAWTSAGRCRAGDALGVVDGDFVLIADDLATAAIAVVDRLLAGGGELLTVVTGRDADPELTASVLRHVRRDRKDVDAVVYDGGQDRYPLLIGVE